MSTESPILKNKSNKTIVKLKSGGERARDPPTRSHDSITMATSVPQARSSPAPKELGRARGCAFTIYDYEAYVEPLREYAKSVKYMVIGYEICPDTKRKHIQGYVSWNNPQSLGEFSRKFGDCHVEAPKGNAKQNRVYCTKDNNFEEYGDIPVQGHRTDWKKALTDLKTRDVVDVLEDQPQLLPMQRALREYKAMLLKPLHREVNVICIVGDAGTGKTRWAFENYADLYKKPVGDWWDGYSGQKAVLMDDFYGWVKYHDLLTLLDRYPTNLPVKGGYIWAQYDTVIITSNKMPQHWYKDLGLTPALRRRLQKVIYYTSIDGISQTQELSLQETPSDPQETGSA